MNISTITKTGRYQITLPKTPPIRNRVESLLRKYSGMNLTEILKLSLIKLDNDTDIITKRTTTPATDFFATIKQDDANIGELEALELANQMLDR